MSRNLICLTIDTDPDGMTGRVMNRETLVWKGLENIHTLVERLSDVPITWFVRADRQIQEAFGSPSHLLERYHAFWSELRAAGHEIGWHPHLYRWQAGDPRPILITGPEEAAAEIHELWSVLRRSFHAESFRNGEGWLHADVFNLLETLGFRWESTAIPGRGPWWQDAPNRPYFPDRFNVCIPGRPRRLLEIPMNTWETQAVYDESPRLRYMNPAVHCGLFEAAAQPLFRAPQGPLTIWTMVLHPDEAVGDSPDALYSRCPSSVCRNIRFFARGLVAAGCSVEFATLSRAGQRWLMEKQ